MTKAEAKKMAETRWGKVRAARGESEAGARCRLIQARADRAELENRVRRGELIERARVERLVFGFARGLRDTLTAWSPRVAATIAANLGAEPHAVEAALAAEVRNLLVELSDRPVPDFESATEAAA
jgi:hypothetical protein